MISPPGSFIEEVDAALAAGLDPLLQASVANVQGPALAGVTLYFIVRGMEMGATGRPWNAATDGLRIGILLALTVRIDLLNYYVRDFFFTGMPNWLMSAYAGKTGTVAITSGASAGAAFNAVWAQIVQIGAQAKAQAVLPGILDVNVLFIDIIQWVSGFFLLLQGIAYGVAKILLLLVVILSPYVFALSIHPSFHGLLQRWVGLCLSYGGTLGVLIIMMQISLSGDQAYLDRILEAQRAYEAAADAMPWYNVPGRVGAANAAMATTIQNVAGMGLWVVAWSIASLAAATVAFFLFGGMTPRLHPAPTRAAYETLMLMHILQNMRLPPVPTAPGGPGGGPNLSLGLNPKALPSGGAAPAVSSASAALPSPPQPLQSRIT